MVDRQQDSFNTKFLFNLLKEYKKSIIIILAISAIAALVFSAPYFIPPLYKSTVVLYPTSSNSISKILISTTYQSEKDIMEFGENEQTEQMLQVLNSNQVRDKVIDQFQLMKHYGIKSNSRYPYTKLNNLYNKRIRFRRTEYNAVKITVLDPDAAMAAEIANSIAEIYDSVMNDMQKIVATKAFKLVESEYFNLCNEMSILEDSLNTLRSLGVFDYESQVEMLSQQLAVELGKGNAQGVKNIQKELDVLAKYGGAYYSISEKLDHDRLQLSLVKTKYEEAKMDATDIIPHKFVVTSAFKAEQKTYPLRWLIVVITLMATFLLIIMVLAAFHQLGSFFRPKASEDAKNKTQETRQH